MNRFARGAMITSLALVVPVTLAAPAHAADVTIRGTDSTVTGQYGKGGKDVVLDRSTGGGTWEFLENGIQMNADTSDERSGVYWDSASDAFPDATDFDWVGTTKSGPDGVEYADPATVIFFDPDGDGPDGRLALLHEDIYGENDAWLAGENAAVQAEAPRTNNGSGSEYSGPLDEWATNLTDAFPELEVLAVGVNLSDEEDDVAGSNGVVSSVTFGEDVYTFTDQDEVTPPAPVEDVRASYSAERDGNRLNLTFTSRAARDEDAVVGEKVRWRVAVNRQVEANYVQGFDEVDTYTRRFPARTGSYEVRVVKNGEIVRTITVNTGNPR